jgi:hypothetical protein
MAQLMHPPLVKDQFIRMVDYVMEPLYHLLMRDSEGISDSDSSRGS